MSENSATPKSTAWIMSLLISVALNGLLIGLLMSGKMAQKTYIAEQAPNRRAPMMAAYDNPRKLLRHLSKARRKEIMANAMLNTRENTNIPTRELMQQMRKTRKRTIALLKEPDLDELAFQEQLEETRQLKDKLGRQGDALVLEIFKQLTPVERESIGRTRHKDNRKAKQKSKN